MMGLYALTAGLASYLSSAGIRAYAGRVESAVYPCCLVEAQSRTRAGTRQLERTVTVTLVCCASPARPREEGLRLLDRVENAVTGGFELGGRRFTPGEVESLLDSKERPRVRFTLEFYDAPGAPESVGDAPGEGERESEPMGALTLTLETEKEE